MLSKQSERGRDSPSTLFPGPETDKTTQQASRRSGSEPAESTARLGPSPIAASSQPVFRLVGLESGQ